MASKKSERAAQGMTTRVREQEPTEELDTPAQVVPISAVAAPAIQQQRGSPTIPTNTALSFLIREP